MNYLHIIYLRSSIYFKSIYKKVDINFLNLSFFNMIHFPLMLNEYRCT